MLTLTPFGCEPDEYSNTSDHTDTASDPEPQVGSAHALVGRFRRNLRFRCNLLWFFRRPRPEVERFDRCAYRRLWLRGAWKEQHADCQLKGIVKRLRPRRSGLVNFARFRVCEELLGRIVRL